MNTNPLDLIDMSHDLFVCIYIYIELCLPRGVIPKGMTPLALVNKLPVHTALGSSPTWAWPKQSGKLGGSRKGKRRQALLESLSLPCRLVRRIPPPFTGACPYPNLPDSTGSSPERLI